MITGREPLAPDQLLAMLAGRRRGALPRGTRRMEALCAALGSPQRGLRAVHVVGTDGKTSVARMVSSLLVAAGVRAGDTTSPHLEDPRERLRIAGHPIEDRVLAAAAVALQAALPEVDRRVGEPATFFEAVTALALRAFVDAGVEVAVVEAGIGGIGDATNVVNSDVTAVTLIAQDHDGLGDSLAAVAREKAAVVAPGGVLVTGPQQPQAAQAIAEVAAQRRARLVRIGHDAAVRWRRPDAAGQVVSLHGLGGLTVEAWLPLIGEHQAVNAVIAVAAVQARLGVGELGPAAVRDGLAAVEVPGRLEFVPRVGAADFVLDGAHDRPAVQALVTSLQELPSARQTAVVLAVGGWRDPRPLVELLGRVTSTFVVTQSSSPAATPTDEVAATLRRAGLEPFVASDARSALALADGLVGAADRLVVTGSLHLVGELRSQITHAASVAA